VAHRSPGRQAVLCAVTLGVSGAIWHYETNRELRDFGAARGRMPFPFIVASPGWSLAAYIGGGLLLALVYLIDAANIFGGDVSSVDDVMTMLTMFSLAAPIFVTAASTARRIKAAQMLAGVDCPRFPNLVLAPVLALVFPAYVWYAQRNLNAAWTPYLAASPAPQRARIELLTNNDLAAQARPAHVEHLANLEHEPMPTAVDLTDEYHVVARNGNGNGNGNGNRPSPTLIANPRTLHAAPGTRPAAPADAGGDGA
jgi:hypothetical protein